VVVIDTCEPSQVNLHLHYVVVDNDDDDDDDGGGDGAFALLTG